MQISRRIYFDKFTGALIKDTGERLGNVLPTTVEYEIEVFKELSERNRDTFDYIELEFGEYKQDFEECNGYRVNPKTKELEFSYPDPNEEVPTELIYQKPLTLEVSELATRTQATEDALLALMTMGGM